MTPTDATQALFPVTPEDRAAAWPHRPACYDGKADKWKWDDGVYDKCDVIQAFARHRQAHSLPGDVIDDLRLVAALTPSPCPGDVGMLAEAVKPFANGCKAVIDNYGPDRPDGQWQTIMVPMSAVKALLAALSPSALSGDAGESAMSKRTFLVCVSGDGPTPYLKIDFANLADAHAAHNELLGIKEEPSDA